MRVSFLAPCAVALALAGCKAKDAKREPHQSDVIGAAAPDAGAVEPEAEGHVILSVRKDSPNMRYAQLGRDACFAELGQRGIAFEEAHRTALPRSAARLPKATKTKKTSKRKSMPAVKQPKQVDANEVASILAPVRLRGPLHGIAIHSGLSEKMRAQSSIEIFDCRLVLALDDFAAMLEQRDVVEIVHMSAFRPERDRGCMPKYTGKQHCGGLAVDVGTFKKKDGTILDVEKDFHGRIGAATCNAGTGPNPVSPSATELWDIVCESARRGLFHVMLTPNYNAEHKNHFHLEVTPEVQWMLIK